MQDFQRSYIAAGLAAWAVLTIVDLTSSDTIVLIPLLVLAPLVASGGTYRGTLLVATLAAATCCPVGVG